MKYWKRNGENSSSTLSATPASMRQGKRHSTERRKSSSFFLRRFFLSSRQCGRLRSACLRIPRRFFLFRRRGAFSDCSILAALSKAKGRNGRLSYSIIPASFLRPLRAGVLTVSDKGSRGEREDTSGPALAERLRGIGCDTAETAVVPDENEAIAAILKNWTDLKDLHLILCTGGTGFSPRDITPEVLESIAGRKVPGIGEAMRQASLRITPKAMLSRSNAVIRGETLIISLPGSAKGATECFDAIAGPLRHGIEILRGWDGECGSPS